jgi:dephospho-CoA kinase
MVIIGLTGGVASGKSAVAAALARRGAIVFDADRLGHRVLEEPDVRDELVSRWGRDILGPDDRIRRDAVAARVFGDSAEVVAERRFLEQTLHPRIRQQIEAEIRQLPGTGVPAVVIDAPLLVESGWIDVCQVVALVDSPRQTLLERARSRGWSAEEFSRREAAQLPIEEKRRRSTHVIDNSGTLADLDIEVNKFWERVVR